MYRHADTLVRTRTYYWPTVPHVYIPYRRARCTCPVRPSSSSSSVHRRSPSALRVSHGRHRHPRPRFLRTRAMRFRYTRTHTQSCRIRLSSFRLRAHGIHVSHVRVCARHHAYTNRRPTPVPGDTYRETSTGSRASAITFRASEIRCADNIGLRALVSCIIIVRLRTTESSPTRCVFVSHLTVVVRAKTDLWPRMSFRPHRTDSVLPGN